MDRYGPIAGGMTSQLQVLDVLVNKPLSDYIAFMGNDCYLGHATNTSRKHNTIRSIDLSMGKTTWNDISPESITRGF
jgi:hypothetical protein